MNLKEALRWTLWIAFGGFLGAFLLGTVTVLWCLPYITEESYCTGDGPFVGYMLVVSTPFMVILGGLIALKLLMKQSLKRALEKEAALVLSMDDEEFQEPSPLSLPSST